MKRRIGPDPATIQRFKENTASFTILAHLDGTDEIFNLSVFTGKSYAEIGDQMAGHYGLEREQLRDHVLCHAVSYVISEAQARVYAETQNGGDVVIKESQFYPFKW